MLIREVVLGVVVIAEGDDDDDDDDDDYDGDCKKYIGLTVAFLFFHYWYASMHGCSWESTQVLNLDGFT